MSGFEMRAKFYPLVTDLGRLKEEAAEGVPYPFLTEEMLELSSKDYRQFCSALGQRYAFETDIPKEGYDTVYGAFHCSLVTAVSEKEAILLTRVAGHMYCSSSDLKNVFKKKLLEEVMECIEEAVPQEKSRSSSRKHSSKERTRD